MAGEVEGMVVKWWVTRGSLGVRASGAMMVGEEIVAERNSTERNEDLKEVDECASLLILTQ